MKRLFMLFAIAFVAVACEGKNEEPLVTPHDPVLTVTSNTSLWVDAEGGEGEITYTIEYAYDELELQAGCNVDWISVEVGSTVRYTVAKNDTDEDRRGVIELTYGTSVSRVSIMQHAPYDSVFEASYLDGSLYVEGDGLHNYYLMLSTVGLSNGYLYPNSNYYCFDLYSATPASGPNGARVPNGTYYLVEDSKLADGTMGYQYSNLTVTSDSDYDEIPFVEAELVVSDNGIVANVALSSGERVRVVYSGSLNIPISSGVENEAVSTLTDDYSFNIEDGVFVGAYVGDLLNNGCNTCQVFMFEYLDYETGEERGDQFQIDLQLPAGGTDVCGEYTVGTEVGHFIPGSAVNYDGQYLQQNSWYMTAGYVDFAPLVGGSVKVEKDAAGKYTFTIDTVDDRGNAIQGVFKGYGEFIEW